jgi:hypothetical protein
MRGALSLPALLVLAWGIAGLLWWDRRRRVIARYQLPWIMAAMALVVAEMLVALVGVPARLDEQLVRTFLLVEACYGLWVLGRRLIREQRNE